MRKLLFFFLLLCTIGCTQLFIVESPDKKAQNASESEGVKSQEVDSTTFYYYCDEKIYLKERKDLVYIKLVDNIHSEQFYSELDDQSLSLWFPRKEILGEGDFDYLVIQSEMGEVGAEDVLRFKNNPLVRFVSYMYEYDGKVLAVTDEFVVKVRGQQGYQKLKELSDQFGCEVSEKELLDEGTYVLTLPKESEFGALTLSNLFYETDLFEYTSPNLCFFNILASSDTYYSDQWGLKNTLYTISGYPAMDIDIESAWGITDGSSSIVVALIDDGVESNHPDLASNLLSALGVLPSGSAPMWYDYHGTPSAGIIGAIKNNSIGISGVAPGCKILPIRAVGNNSTDAIYLASAFNVARTNGADVICCNWSNVAPLYLLTDAISNATVYGRSGKGCVVIFAAGNNNTTVSYPANEPKVLTVGAISIDGQRKTPSSPDGDTTWGSDYGAALNVVAPGVRIATTDLQGTDGYNDYQYYYAGITDYSDKDYTRIMNGTSAASSFAAGVAALELSLYPNLKESQVRRAIELGCTKWPSYTFTSDGQYPEGSRNNEIGFGLLNAYNALNWASVFDQQNVLDATAGFDFVINNYSSYPLDEIYVDLTGYIGSSVTTLVSCDPGAVASGGVLGYPMFRGETLTATPGSTISNISLEFYARCQDYSGNLRIGAAIDDPNPVNYSSIAFGGGNTFWGTIANSTVPNASRRKLYINILNP